MRRKRLILKLFLVSGFSIFFCISSAQAYYFDKWSTDGYFKSQFGIFTEKKPFNEPEFGGSDDNIATAKQMFRWNLNGSITDKIGLKAEALAVWEPDYPGEKGVMTTKVSKVNGRYVSSSRPLRANFYNSFDWRELTLEYKPTYAHTIRFGRQIINWGEAISGRVIDQINPTDSRASAGFLNLEDIYMPLWMFRGIHDLSRWNTVFEWIVSPIWQADRYENPRAAGAWPRSGDGRTTNSLNDPNPAVGGPRSYSNRPWMRYAANNEARTEKFYGADTILFLNGNPAMIYGGGPFGTGYGGTNVIPASFSFLPFYPAPGDPIRPLTRAEATTLLGMIPGATTAYLGERNVFWSEIPSTDGTIDPRYGADLPDHNFKNTRWGFKTRHRLGGAELGFAFYQGPGHGATYHYKYKDTLAYRTANGISGTPSGRLIFQRIVPRYNTFGLYGNYQFPLFVFMFESAYMPDREFHKAFMGLVQDPGQTAEEFEAEKHRLRLNSVKEVDQVVTLLGLTREQKIPFLNEFQVFTFRLQYTATNYLADMDDVTRTTYFMDYDQMEHNISLTTSTNYSYGKYTPGLTISADPRGAVLTSFSMGYVPEGFNARLRVSFNVTNYWTANEYSAPLSLLDKNDSVTVGFTYSFY